MIGISGPGRWIAALALGAVGFASLAGCGNGVEVRGPQSTPPSGSAAPTKSQPSGDSSTDPSADSSDQPTATPSDSQPSADQSASAGSGGDNNGDNNGNHSGQRNGGNRHKGSGTDGGKDGGTGGGKGGGTGHKPGSGGGSNTGGGSSGGTPSPSGQDTPSAPTVKSCGLDDLKIGTQTPEGGGAAGTQYVLLTFANTSSDPCTMKGFAGVSFVGDHNGTQFGRPAVRERSGSASTVRLAPGETQFELLGISEAGNYDPEQCQPKTADGFRVYPPDSYTSAYVPFSTHACQGKKVRQLTVYPVGTKS